MDKTPNGGNIMSVADILGAKGREVVTTKADVTLEEASKILSHNKVGATVVLDGNENICGIISERDIVRQVAKSGADALNQPVSTCMTQKVISCVGSDSIDTVMGKMTAGRFRHLPVIENGKLTGIISIGDVVKRKIEQAERDAEDLKQYIAG